MDYYIYKLYVHYIDMYVQYCITAQLILLYRGTKWPEILPRLCQFNQRGKYLCSFL